MVSVFEKTRDLEQKFGGLSGLPAVWTSTSAL
jgi:hypothetical protein